MNISLYFLIGFIVCYAWLAYNKVTYFNPFPFFKGQTISVQVYMDYLGWRCFVVILSLLLHNFVRSTETFVLVILTSLFAVDFALSFNQPYGYFNGSISKNKPDGFFIPLSYSLLMALILVLMSFINLWKK